MRRYEAIEAMKKGDKVTHPLFLDEHYWITMEGMDIVTSCGEYFSILDFWSDKKWPQWEKNWSIKIIPETLFNMSNQRTNRQILLDNNFKDDSDTLWEVYKKKYEYFTLCVMRHRHTSKENLYNVVVICNEHMSEDIDIKDVVDIEWVLEFDKLINR